MTLSRRALLFTTGVIAVAAQARTAHGGSVAAARAAVRDALAATPVPAFSVAVFRETG